MINSNPFLTQAKNIKIPMVKIPKIIFNFYDFEMIQNQIEASFFMIDLIVCDLRG